MNACQPFFFCGHIGHNKKFCEKLFDCNPRPEMMPYGIELRAPNCREVNQVGERWLRTSVPAPAPVDCGDVKRRAKKCWWKRKKLQS